MLGNNVKQTDLDVIPLGECIAKSGRDQPGISVENHCRIVGLVAQELICLFPEEFRKSLFPEGSDFIAACHDIGKVSPAFQKMIYGAIPQYSQKYEPIFSLVNSDNARRRTPGFHAAVSQVSIDDSCQYIPEILGIHHGFSPSTNGMQKGCSLHGGKKWQVERENLIKGLREYFSYTQSVWPVFGKTQASVVSGLVTVADWIGSGDSFVDFTLDKPVTRQELIAKASDSVCLAGFQKVCVKQGLSFQDIFHFSPYAVQTALIEAVNRPGVYILEAPMGIGKTEAALFAAYIQLAKGNATGIYFALPTQLTSEKIHERMGIFLDRVIDPSSGVARAQLLHGAAWLKDKPMGENADAGGSWFDGSKRGILAPFAAGTIDQALMAVMNVRHGFVRTFGLAGKVVILDEVHSYDSFTGTILNRLVDELRNLHCTVIILSATLTSNQRRSLLMCDDGIMHSSAYPLVSSMPLDSKSELIEQSCPDEHNDKVCVRCRDDLDCVVAEVLERAAQGEQVLWIENTVTEAQDIFRRLSAKCSDMDVECGLLHSRYLKIDREKIEDKWVSLYGKNGFDRRKEKGRILVGTQVLEQSIDIDADYLVTRLCPTDMLLQRSGRLWRHRINDMFRPPSAVREMTVLAPSYVDALEKPRLFGKSGTVYSEYVLLRSLDIWKDCTSISIPGDIRRLIEDTYIERDESGLSARYKRELVEKKDTLQRLARVGLSRGIETLPESKASTRYSELETVDVLLLKTMHVTEKEMKLVFIDGSSIIAPLSFPGRTQCRTVAATIIKNTVRVSEYIAPQTNGVTSKFKEYIYIGSKDDEEEPFRVAILARDDEILGADGSRGNADYILQYDSVTGYQSKKRQGE